MFIAEVGINHNGNLEYAYELIDIAYKAGADVVKFQKRNPKKCVPKDQWHKKKKTPWGEMDYIDYKYRMEFGYSEYVALNAYCHKLGVKWTASVWDIESLEFLTDFNVPFIKIASASITDMKLLEAVRKTGIPVVLSTGMSTEEEIDKAVNVFEGYEDKLSIMHCNSSYPSAENELDLRIIERLKEKYPLNIIGYSGHEKGIQPTIAAKVLGAEIIERHITLDKDMWGSDHSASLEYKELKELIDNLNRVDNWLGSDNIKVYESEEKVKEKLRK